MTNEYDEATIERVDVSAYKIATDAWDSTTLVVAEATGRGRGYT